MKLVFVIDHLRPDGTQAALVQIVTGLASRGHTQTVICLNDSDDDIVNRLDAAGAKVRIIGKLSLMTGHGIVSLLHYFRKEKFDVAITFLHASDVLGRVLARWARIPRIISSLRARNINYSRLQRWLVRRTVNMADAVVLNSSYVREFSISEEGAQPNRVHIIPNAVNVVAFANPISQTFLREKLDLPATGWLIGTVGRLTRQKGIDNLLHALTLINNREFILLIFGTGEDESALRALAANLGLESRAHFVGYRRDLPSIIGSLDLYVHSARFEGMPNAVLEAMAAACPIVATKVDGIRELIEDGNHGWLVSADSPKELAVAIGEALNDSKEAHRRGVLARERVLQAFSLESMIESWEAILTAKKSTPNCDESSYRYAG